MNTELQAANSTVARDSRKPQPEAEGRCEGASLSIQPYGFTPPTTAAARQIVEEIDRAVANQLGQLADDLHDTLGQQIAALGLLAETLTHCVASDAMAMHIAQEFGSIVAAAKLQLQTIIEAAGGGDAVAAEVPQALEGVVRDAQRHHGIAVELVKRDSVTIDDPFVMQQLLLIARLSVWHLSSRAGASRVTIELDKNPEPRLTVTGEGTGTSLDFAPLFAASLPSLEWRCRAIGGTLMITSSPAGTLSMCCALARGT